MIPDPRARPLLEQMLLGQAWREQGAVTLFEEGAKLAPDEAGRARLQAQAEEERRHFQGVARAWQDLTGEGESQLNERVAARLREKPLPRPTSWIEVAVAQLLYDRAGTFQLREYRDCSWEPYRRLVEPILAEEERHQDDGAAELQAALATSGGDAAVLGEAQAAVDKWWPVAMASFGRSGTGGSAQAVSLGLKRRDPALVARDFVANVAALLRAVGLRAPEPD